MHTNRQMWHLPLIPMETTNHDDVDKKLLQRMYYLRKDCWHRGGGQGGRMKSMKFIPGAVLLLSAFVGLLYSARGQQEQPKISKFERDEVLQMLNTISDDVKKHYYDPKLHGIDWGVNVKNFQQRIDNAASLNRGLSEVAAALDVLNDSHTFFVPPPRPYKHDYGWRIQMIGQKCYVTAVRPEVTRKRKESNAEMK
jgi:tricorn protease-like protein